MRSGLLLFVAGCATAPVAGREYPAPPRVHLDAGDFVWRQHVVARRGKDEGGFDAVIQKRGGEVLLLGLTPFGTKAFELTWNDGQVRSKIDVPIPMPFPSAYVFDDVARTYLCGLPGAPLSDGEHAQDVEGERISEVWSGGRLMSRSYTRLSGDLKGEIRIQYVGGMAKHQSPPLVEFENGWFGYHLTIRTLSERPL